MALPTDLPKELGQRKIWRPEPELVRTGSKPVLSGIERPQEEGESLTGKSRKADPKF